MRMVVLLVVALVVTLAAVPAMSAPETSNAPVRLEFDKTSIDGVEWNGTVSGDIEGTVKTTLISITPPLDRTNIRPPYGHQVLFLWEIEANDPSLSFDAELRGTFNTNTGRVVMNGEVVDGYLLGAQVHEEGQLIDLQALRFVGTIRIMPATS